MPDENQPSTSETSTTNETMTALGAGLARETDQTSTNETSPAAPSTSAEAKAPPPGAPEAYSDWKLPEGFELDDKINEAAKPLFKELGLTQDNAQKLVDFYNEHAKRISEERDKGLMDYWQKTRSDWRDELKKDDVVGKLVGENGNFGPDSALITTVNKALDGLQDPKLVSDFKDAMELTGAGDNPAFVKVLYALSKKVTEGSSYAAGNPSPLDPKTGQVRGSRPTAGAAIYPHLPSAGSG